MSNKELSAKRIFNLIAFIGLLCVAAALIARYVLKLVGITDMNIIQLISDIGSLISSIILIVVAYAYVRTKRKPVWIVLYAVSVTVVIILQVLNFII